jgi:hypothetical protein
MPAIDLATRITPAMIPAMKAAGIEAVCRYLSNSPAKNLSLDEAKLLSAAGIKCVVVWEAQGDRYSNFTPGQGFTDAERAGTQAAALNVPPLTTIYFAVDFDASGAQIASGITDYFRAVSAKVLLAGYGAGVYGNGAVCAAMLDAKIADKAWVWGAGGTNGTQAFIASNRWSIRQHPTVNEFGASVDPDDVQGDYGGWLFGGTAAAPVLLASPGPVIAIPEAKALQTALKAAGRYVGLVDNDWGPRSSAALTAYYAGV